MNRGPSGASLYSTSAMPSTPKSRMRARASPTPGVVGGTVRFHTDVPPPMGKNDRVSRAEKATTRPRWSTAVTPSDGPGTNGWASGRRPSSPVSAATAASACARLSTTTWRSWRMVPSTGWNVRRGLMTHGKPSPAAAATTAAALSAPMVSGTPNPWARAASTPASLSRNTSADRRSPARTCASAIVEPGHAASQQQASVRSPEGTTRSKPGWSHASLSAAAKPAGSACGDGSSAVSVLQRDRDARVPASVVTAQPTCPSTRTNSTAWAPCPSSTSAAGALAGTTPRVCHRFSLQARDFSPEAAASRASRPPTTSDSRTCRR